MPDLNLEVEDVRFDDTSMSNIDVRFFSICVDRSVCNLDLSIERLFRIDGYLDERKLCSSIFEVLRD